MLLLDGSSVCNHPTPGSLVRFLPLLLPCYSLAKCLGASHCGCGIHTPLHFTLVVHRLPRGCQRTRFCPHRYHSTSFLLFFLTPVIGSCRAATREVVHSRPPTATRTPRHKKNVMAPPWRF
uniref:Uncharacterized protein n=1 Tax=Trypanosoma vivax (strain Y486) TaxID=1055687 RepID=G0U827_TRYVY|nr:hypothetical protein, unlikely [Trypanosoma vivax Y486]